MGAGKARSTSWTARGWSIDEPTVLTQVVGNLVDGLRLDQADADTKGDLFEHVLRQIKQAGELGQFRTPRHIIRAIVEMSTPRSARPSTTRQPARRAFWWRPTTTSAGQLLARGMWTVDSTASAARAAWANALSAAKWRLQEPPSSATTWTRRWCAWPP
jgi:hypothetical protein